MQSAEGEAGTSGSPGSSPSRGPGVPAAPGDRGGHQRGEPAALPRPSAKDEAAWVEPAGSGQAKGLGGAAGGLDGASQAEPAWGGLGPEPGRDKAGHQLQEPQPAKGKILKRSPPGPQSSLTAQARQLCPLPFLGCPALLYCLFTSNPFTSLFL